VEDVYAKNREPFPSFINIALFGRSDDDYLERLIDKALIKICYSKQFELLWKDREFIQQIYSNEGFPKAAERVLQTINDLFSGAADESKYKAAKANDLAKGPQYSVNDSLEHTLQKKLDLIGVIKANANKRGRFQLAPEKLPFAKGSKGAISDLENAIGRVEMAQRWRKEQQKEARRHAQRRIRISKRAMRRNTRPRHQYHRW